MAAKRPLFITFEGGEGAGKSTLMKSLESELLCRGHEVLVTREPGGSQLGDQIRQLLLHSASPIAPKAELLLFLASRAQHLEELIKPALAHGKIVLCDRFNDSTIAYQGMARGLGMQPVHRLCDFVCAETQPDLTFFLDISPEEGLRRRQQVNKEHVAPGEFDRIEKEKLLFHQKVREGLQQLAEQHPERIVLLDAHQPINQVVAQAIEALDHKLEKLKKS